ncbi:MAG: amidohydrolase, partial [Bacteroidia bacterium]
MKNLYLLIFIMVTAFRGGRVDAIRDQVKPEAQQQRVWVIRHVNIIPMTAENKVIENATVLIRGNHIISINGAVPDSAEIIDGKGKWLIPGLIDMHVHIPVDGHFNT